MPRERKIRPVASEGEVMPVRRVRKAYEQVNDQLRELIVSGELAGLISDDGLRGITSNPTIFEKALSEGDKYDDDIARLDGHWQSLADRQRTAMEFTNKLTQYPHEVRPVDVQQLREHFDDQQLVELIYTVAFYNNVNRWTDALGLPQDRAFRQAPVRFDEPTSNAFRDLSSRMVSLDAATRPALEARDTVEQMWEACRDREPLVALPDTGKVQEMAGELLAGNSPCAWMQPLAYFPEVGRLQIAAWQAIDNGDALDGELTAALVWTTARHNRAWYALAQAKSRLEHLGWSADDCFALDDPANCDTEAQHAALQFARKLTTEPQQITDSDIARLREHYTDRQTAQIVYVISAANMFDRFTEALQLPLW
jgi:alkylhydroperoxidase family enzyme